MSEFGACSTFIAVSTHHVHVHLNARSNIFVVKVNVFLKKFGKIVLCGVQVCESVECILGDGSKNENVTSGGTIGKEDWGGSGRRDVVMRTREVRHFPLRDVEERRRRLEGGGRSAGVVLRKRQLTKFVGSSLEKRQRRETFIDRKKRAGTVRSVVGKPKKLFLFFFCGRSRRSCTRS